MKTLLLTPGSRRDPRQHPGPRPPLHLPPLLRLRQVLQASRLDRLPAAAQEERGQDALLQHPGNCLLHLLGLFLLVGGAVGGGCLATAAIVTTNFGQSRNRETAAPNVTEPPRMSGEGHAQLRTGESRPLYLSGNLNLSFCHFYLFLGVVWIKKFGQKSDIVGRGEGGFVRHRCLVLTFEKIKKSFKMFKML